MGGIDWGFGGIEPGGGPFGGAGISVVAAEGYVVLQEGKDAQMKYSMPRQSPNSRRGDNNQMGSQLGRVGRVKLTWFFWSLQTNLQAGSQAPYLINGAYAPCEAD